MAAALSERGEPARSPRSYRSVKKTTKARSTTTVIALRRIQDVMTAVSSLVKGAPPTLEKVGMWGVAERAVAAVRPHEHPHRDRGRGVRARLGQTHRCSSKSWPTWCKTRSTATLGQEKRHVLVRVYAASGEARISVRDNGPGVPAALRQRIFEPFFTTKGERGTGLGLVLVRHAVSRMGGTLSLGPANAARCFAFVCARPSAHQQLTRTA